MPEQEGAFGALQAMQGAGPQGPVGPEGPAGPITQEEPQESVKPTREIKITDKQPDGSELKMTLKGDQLQNERMQFILRGLVESGDPAQMGVAPDQEPEQQIGQPIL